MLRERMKWVKSVVITNTYPNEQCERDVFDFVVIQMWLDEDFRDSRWQELKEALRKQFKRGGVYFCSLRWNNPKKSRKNGVQCLRPGCSRGQACLNPGPRPVPTLCSQETAGKHSLSYYSRTHSHSRTQVFSSASYLTDVELVECLWKHRRVVVHIAHGYNNFEGNLEPKTNTVNIVFFKKNIRH